MDVGLIYINNIIMQHDFKLYRIKWLSFHKMLQNQYPYYSMSHERLETVLIDIPQCIILAIPGTLKSMIASESSTEHFWEFQPNCMMGILPISHSVIATSTIIHLIVPSIICIRGNMSWLIFSSVWKADTSLENIPQLCINCQLYTAWNASYKIHEILCIYNWRASSTSSWEIGCNTK